MGANKITQATPTTFGGIFKEYSFKSLKKVFKFFYSFIYSRNQLQN
jgi:hypothetical protein